MLLLIAGARPSLGFTAGIVMTQLDKITAAASTNYPGIMTAGSTSMSVDVLMTVSYSIFLKCLPSYIHDSKWSTESLKCRILLLSLIDASEMQNAIECF